MKKKLCALLIFLCGAVVGCGSTVMTKADQEYPLKIYKQNRNGQMETWILKDDETKVNYIVVATTYGNGHSYEALGVIERKNPDGTLYVDK